MLETKNKFLEMENSNLKRKTEGNPINSIVKPHISPNKNSKLSLEILETNEEYKPLHASFNSTDHKSSKRFALPREDSNPSYFSPLTVRNRVSSEDLPDIQTYDNQNTFEKSNK